MVGLVYELASGRPLFVSLVLLLLLLAAQAVLPEGSRRWRLTTLAGAAVLAFVVAVSAPPVPVALIAAFWAAFAFWLVVTAVGRSHRLHLVRAGAAALGIATLMMLGLELVWGGRPGLGSLRHDRLVVIGDSVAAGIGGVSEVTWPQMLGERYGVRVDNVAIAGARVANAVAMQLPLVEAGPAMVLLEIGGNDLLSGVPLDRFERDLTALVHGVEGDGRTLIMFELPTPPFHGGYARVQRRIARRHGVHLLPRRDFVDVVRRSDATLDGVHLSPVGQQRMADMVGSALGDHLGGG